MSLAAFDEVNLKGESLSALFFFFFSIWCFTANPQPQTCHHRHQDTIGLPLRYGSEQPKIKSTEPPACPFACSLALLTYSLAILRTARRTRLACVLHCVHLFTRSLTHTQAHGEMSLHQAVLNHSALISIPPSLGTLLLVRRNPSTSPRRLLSFQSLPLPVNHLGWNS